jgi:hypothetical protein
MLQQCKYDPSADAKDGAAARVLLDFLIAMSMVELGQVRRLFAPEHLACANYSAPQTWTLMHHKLGVLGDWDVNMAARLIVIALLSPDITGSNNEGTWCLVHNQCHAQITF